jgi:hypothetical protein
MEATAYQQIRDSLLRLHLDDPRPWLVSYSSGCRVLVATNRFDEAGDAAFLLKRMAGRQVQLPGKRDYWPDKTHLAWHRENRLAIAQELAVSTGNNIWNNRNQKRN